MPTAIPLRRVPAIAILTALAVSALAGAARAGLVDFESPSLGAGSSQILSPYDAPGVSFDVSGGDGPILLRESAYSSCVAPEDTNQLLMGQWSWSCPLCSGPVVRATFDVNGDPVYAVSADVRGDAPNLSLLLYDSGDQLLASSVATPPSNGCWMGYRSALSAVAGAPVAYALVVTSAPPPDECGGWSCSTLGNVVVDTFVFGAAAVPARSTSWGSLKVRYR